MSGQQRQSGQRKRGAPPRPMAAAVSYTPGDGAPRVVAHGLGHVATRIIAEAEANGVPIQIDPALAGGLLAVEVGREIPPELYEAVAAVLAFLYRLEQGQAAGAGRRDA